MNPQLPEGEPLRTPREVCARLRISDQTLRKLDRERRLAALRVGGKVRRYREQDVAAYLDSLAASAAAAAQS